MTHCRVCGTLERDMGESVVCEDCADNLLTQLDTLKRLVKEMQLLVNLHEERT
jgi:predicted nucleic acid-binding Zn ribbon protein